jgi:hypothetical protein
MFPQKNMSTAKFTLFRALLIFILIQTVWVDSGLGQQTPGPTEVYAYSGPNDPAPIVIGQASTIPFPALVAVLINLQVVHADDYIVKPQLGVQADGGRRYAYNPRVLDLANVDLVRKDVTLINKSGERFEKLRGFHRISAIDQHLPVYLRAGEADLFQERDFAAIEFDFADHGKTFLLFIRMSSSLWADPSGRVFTQPIPDPLQVLTHFALASTFRRILTAWSTSFSVVLYGGRKRRVVSWVQLIR